MLFRSKDPSSGNAEIQKEAQESGLYPIQFTKIAADKYEVQSGFMGVVMYYQDKKEVIPYVKDTQDLEYLISSSFKKLVNPVKKKAAFLTSFGAADLSGDSELKALLAKEYDVVNITTATQNTDYSVLLFVSPREKLSAENLAWLKDRKSTRLNSSHT